MARQDRQFPTYDVTSGQQRWKRYALVRWSGIVGVLIFSGLWLAACGEGGDNTGTNPSPPTTTTASRVSSAQASAQVALTAVTDSLQIVEGQAGAGSLSALRTFNSASVEELMPTVQRFYKALEDQVTITPRAVVSCPNSGTLNITSTATGTTAVFTNCQTLIDINGDGRNDASQIINGSLSTTGTFANFAITLTNLTSRTTRLTNNSLVEESTFNSTFTVTTPSSTSCGGGRVPTASTLVLNGTGSTKQDTDGNGTVDIDESLNFQSLTLTVRINRVDPSVCTPLDLSVSLAGTLSITNNLDATQSFALTSPTSNPLTLALSTVAGGTNLTIGGSFSESSPCFTGSLSLNTLTPIFVPTTIFGVAVTRPTAGVLTVTGDQRGTIRYTSTGGVTIDNGSDGSIDQTFPTCTSAKICV